MESSPFSRSSRTARSPPPAPSPASTPAARSEAPTQSSDDLEVISTPEIQTWMKSIEQCLNEVCSIAADSKMNTDQKLRINNLCRKLANGTSQMAVQYQSLKMKAVQAHTSVQALQDEVELSQRIKDLQQRVEELSKPVNQVSFADMLKKGANDFIPAPKLNSLAIYPEDKLKTSDDTKSLVQKIICPEKMKLNVRGLRKTRNGGVIISTETKDDIDKLKQSMQLTNAGLKVNEAHKRNPRVVIIGVPTSMEDMEVFTCLYHQNLADKLQNSFSNLETFLSSIKLSHKSGKKNIDTCNFVIEVPAHIRKCLIEKDRVFLNWSSCPVRDFTLVIRCYKCQQFGHAAKTCREDIYTCGHCGEQGHSIKEYLKKADLPKCATCSRFKKPCDHSTGAADCPAKQMAERRYISSIDYGII